MQPIKPAAQKANITRVSVRTAAQSVPVSSIPRAGSVRRSAPARRLSRYFVMLCFLMLCAVAIHNGVYDPSAVLSASAVPDDSWDEQLGKISFVGRFFPETLSVFWTQTADAITLPGAYAISHVWETQEPYYAFCLTDDRVSALTDGVIDCVTAETDGTRTVTVAVSGRESARYSLVTRCSLQPGDRLLAGDEIGRCDGKELIFAYYRDGVPIRLSVLEGDAS